MTPCRSNNSTSPLPSPLHSCLVEVTTGKKQVRFQTRYHMGRSLTLPLCLLVLAGNNGVAFTPWVALPGEITPDVHHPLFPGTPPCHDEATNRTGHGHFPAYSHRFHLSNSPSCSCGQLGDADHYIFDCTLTKEFHLKKPTEQRTKCTKDEECVHPLKCVDRGNGDGQVCAHASCPRRQVCAYPLDCLNLGNGEGPVCAHKKCSKDDECTKILKCVDRGHGEGPVCAYKKCTSADECAYPLRCADQATGEGQVCARTKCTKDDECTYPLKCTDQGTITEGRVCSQDYCTRDDKCVYPLKCVYQEYQGAKLCTKTKCTKDAECTYPLRCVDQGIVEGHVCELTKCTKDVECAYPLRCVVQEFVEGHVCAHTKCNRDDEFEYPLKCVDQDVRGRDVCAHKKCTKDDECAYPLECVEKAFGEGHVCTRKQCNNDDDCQYPLKCEDRGAWEGKVCSECDCGVYGSCTFIGRSKKCICSPATHEKDGKCVECDCGPHGLCIFEFGQKKCVCSPYSTEKDGKCIVAQTSTLVTTDSSSLMTAILTSTVSTCYCGPETKTCYLDSSGNKNCSCFSGYVPINGYCAECNCGPYGTCSFEYGLKKCNCRSFATETNGVCVEMLSSSSKGTTDSFITSTILSSTVQECDCGPRGRCDVAFGRRKCICDLLTAEKDGKCVDCNCGVNSKACSFDWKGNKLCNCYSGYAEVYGFCLGMSHSNLYVYSKK
ncbi:hypothetical protein AVEN_128752-2 [Araneus ventricosus]|uniref:Uncharacterized protein n=1 Tax=Araneus ventricosus TaxID=182803 RepID=A0A4Y2IWV4_ARAVE|nr:hypothetical protein AVEN_128752-2 [Araneus ventricosus]